MLILSVAYLRGWQIARQSFGACITQSQVQMR